MRKIIHGLVDFRERLLPQYAARFRALTGGQKPEVFAITCTDSRVVPELVSAADPGDLFVMRNVGNLIPPAMPEGGSTGDLSEAGAIEYAVLVLKVPTIVVCGHSECGAMKAALARKVMPEAPNLGKWLRHADTAVFRLEQEGPLNASFRPHDQLSQLNVLVQLEHVMSYPIVRERVAAGSLRLGGWWFEVATGNMFVYEPTTRSFEILDRQKADQILARLDAEQGRVKSTGA